MSKYCHSNDGELYYGEFDTEQDALEDAKESYPGESEIYIGTCTKPVFRWNGCEEKIIDSIKENLAEDVGEAAENFEVSVEQELELARMIDETVKAWIEQEEIEPSCYFVLDGHIVSLNKKFTVYDIVRTQHYTYFMIYDGGWKYIDADLFRECDKN